MSNRVCYALMQFDAAKADHLHIRDHARNALAVAQIRNRGVEERNELRAFADEVVRWWPERDRVHFSSGS